MSFPGFHTNLHKACDDGLMDDVSNGFISVKIVAGKHLTKYQEIISNIENTLLTETDLATWQTFPREFKVPHDR